MKFDLDLLNSTVIDQNRWYLAGATVIGASLFVRKLLICRRNRAIQKSIDELRADREASFEHLRQGLEATSTETKKLRKQIVAMPIRELLGKLQSEELKPIDVVQAYQVAALAAHERTNSICFFIIEATGWAHKLWITYSGKVKPPLYGLPFSVKESIAVKGYLSTRGYSHPVLHPLEYVGKKDAVIVAQLKELGAIPFCTTNVPQTLMSFVTSNPVYGPSRHPHPDFSDRNPGGSSGGESALIAAGGSLFGLGSDIAGSIRMPSHVCGIAGLKPTSFRMSKDGELASVPGRNMVFAAIGPLARDTETIIVVVRALWNNYCTSNLFTTAAVDVNKRDPERLTYNRELFDHLVPPLRFNDDVLTPPVGSSLAAKMCDGEKIHLRIGYYDDDEFFPAIPAVKRAVCIAKDILEAKGHEMVHIAPPNVWSAIKFTIPAMYSDGGRYMAQEMAKGIVDTYHKPHYSGYCVPLFVRRWLYSPIARLFWGVRPQLCYSEFVTNMYSLAEAYVTAADFQISETKRFSEELGLDAWICPPNAGVATPHHVQIKTLMAASYTFIYNMLNYPAGVVPITHVTEDDDISLQKSYPASDALLRLVKQGNVMSKGLPVGVQCVSYPYQDEMVLRVMKEIEDEIRNN